VGEVVADAKDHWLDDIKRKVKLQLDEDKAKEMERLRS